jgi:hypothetical protein
LPIQIEEDSRTEKFSHHYKEQLFLIWYQEGKPVLRKFYEIMPLDSADRKPTLATLQVWASELNWKERALDQDEEVRKQLEHQAIATKVEMLNRHAETGKELQQIGIEYIREHLDQIRPSTAVRMIIEGIRIEEGSRGIGTALKEALEMTDDELTSKVEDLLLKSKVEIQMLDDGD